MLFITNTVCGLWLQVPSYCSNNFLTLCRYWICLSYYLLHMLILPHLIYFSFSFCCSTSSIYLIVLWVIFLELYTQWQMMCTTEKQLEPAASLGLVWEFWGRDEQYPIIDPVGLHSVPLLFSLVKITWLSGCGQMGEDNNLRE